MKFHLEQFIQDENDTDSYLLNCTKRKKTRAALPRHSSVP